MCDPRAAAPAAAVAEGAPQQCLDQRPPPVLAHEPARAADRRLHLAAGVQQRRGVSLGACARGQGLLQREARAQRRRERAAAVLPEGARPVGVRSQLLHRTPHVRPEPRRARKALVWQRLGVAQRQRLRCGERRAVAKCRREALALLLCPLLLLLLLLLRLRLLRLLVMVVPLAGLWRLTASPGRRQKFA